MKKKLRVIRITAVIVAVIFCTLLGCERKEKEADELLLLLEGEADAAAEKEESATAPLGEAEPVRPEAENEQSSQPGATWPEAAIGQTARPEAEDKTLVVHICGAVKEPGVYVMDGDSRIYQAVEKAGGFSPEADENYLNQADLLSDGMKIYVPTKAEVEESGEEAAWKVFGNSGAETADKGQQKKDLQENSFLVNINTAGEAELTTLPGVGSSKAKSIIAYREKNGAYQRIEDIMNVEGIKDGVFQKIKDSITV